MKLLGKILIGIGMADAFFSLLLHLSGVHSWTWSAMNGREEGEQYYLGSHGNSLEVSHSTFQHYLWEEYAEMAAVGFMFCGLGILILQQRKSNETVA